MKRLVLLFASSYATHKHPNNDITTSIFSKNVLKSRPTKPVSKNNWLEEQLKREKKREELLRDTAILNEDLYFKDFEDTDSVYDQLRQSVDPSLIFRKSFDFDQSTDADLLRQYGDPDDPESWIGDYNYDYEQSYNAKRCPDLFSQFNETTKYADGKHVLHWMPLFGDGINRMYLKMDFESGLAYRERRIFTTLNPILKPCSIFLSFY